MVAMLDSRRLFLQRTISFLCCFGTFVYGALPLLSRRFYVFKVSMVADQGFFVPNTRFWEDQDGLEQINSRYYKSGKLLALKEVKNKKNGTITWFYMFDEKKSFKQWDNEVLSTGLFRQDNIPTNVIYEVEEFSS